MVKKLSGKHADSHFFLFWQFCCLFCIRFQALLNIEMSFLSSTQNQRVKDLVRLQDKAAERDFTQQFVVEGFREIKRALLSGYQADALFWYENLDPLGMKRDELLVLQPSIPITGISREVFQKMAYRESSDGLIAVLRMKTHSLKDLVIPTQALIVVIESIEKPGNLGAILRTCDGAGVDAVIVCNAKTDIYNPNCIRSSVGCIFSVSLALDSSENTIQFLKENHIRTFAAALSSNNDYYAADYTPATAFILGTEAEGLSETWLNNADQKIKIPMKGIADSLNVSITAGILVYEALRQRN